MSLLKNMNLSGLDASIPAAGNAGRLYFATDTNKVYVDTGTSWTAVLVTPSAGMTNPMTTAGDLIIGGSGGAPSRFAKGTDGTVLTMVSGAITWANPTGGIANIVVALPTSAIAANATSGNLSAAMTGVTTSSVFETAFATDPTSVAGWGESGGLVLAAWPTAGTFNYCVMNQSSASITPGAININVGAR